METVKANVNNIETIVTLWIPESKFQYVNNFVIKLHGRYRGNVTPSNVGLHMKISFASIQVSNTFKKMVGIINQPFF